MKRILTIDGGGVRGIFPAAFLAEIELQTGRRAGEYFDLIAGTSTGGILALALGLRIPASEIVKLYAEEGTKIFGGSRFFRSIANLLFAKYSSLPLKQALVSKFQERMLGDSKSRLLIPSFDVEKGQVHVFKTRHHARFSTDYRTSIVDVALATSAAPTYFMSHRLASGPPLVDGGVWANNPIASAAIEATSVLKWSAEDCAVLSLGCTNPPLDIGRGRDRSVGWAYWGLKATDLFLSAQSSASMGMATLILGKEQIVRVNPVTPKGRFSLDGLTEIESLRGLGFSEARTYLPALRTRFFDHGPANEFVPEG